MVNSLEKTRKRKVGEPSTAMFLETRLAEDLETIAEGISHLDAVNKELTYEAKIESLLFLKSNMKLQTNREVLKTSLRDLADKIAQEELSKDAPTVSLAEVVGSLALLDKSDTDSAAKIYDVIKSVIDSDAKILIAEHTRNSFSDSEVEKTISASSATPDLELTKEEVQFIKHLRKTGVAGSKGLLEFFKEAHRSEFPEIEENG